MFSIFRTKTNHNSMNTTGSKLYNQQSFYDAFEQDLRYARSLVVIESPFITMKRLNTLLPAIRQLRARGVRVIVNTKPFEEHDQVLYRQAVEATAVLQEIGVTVLMTVGHHRKVAIIDDNILWEGSLNILSQNDSSEFMRRIYSDTLAQEMLRFIGVKRWLSKMDEHKAVRITPALTVVPGKIGVILTYIHCLLPISCTNRLDIH